jgi:hypothetical protein
MSETLPALFNPAFVILLLLPFKLGPLLHSHFSDMGLAAFLVPLAAERH